ncbi:conserved hypothetical protein [Gluconacetobacter diazotrophicus PA1 5]|uniref:Uncharacterized protein n=3 Tax=Gluconacetobacter diazotrophicus TaxID=33996 RepID=A9HK51_GLUDA|nr:conserved hypothetical protein [Gluconacetobacter diazotrophicus PA1 5]MBB2156235.1 DUF4169 family protein [Gluconacetobacter diazotrophicus]TWB07849.1 uncharacterized protein DUF4169 [Gluconacetobacter diazotrophicus]CAP55996.1 conserved hypothetical protein [Gluconacetobacter diazotrophicus PA1 5]
MAEIVNLRQARKRKARADKARDAAENRALHGRTLSERARRKQEAERAARTLDGARLDPDPGEPGRD